MESYIRPGCVVLSIYFCMLAKDWEQLEGNFLREVSSLVNHSKSGFWRNGKFLVQTNRQMASHRNGKIRVWRTSSAPELISVTPFAIVSGCKTTILLKGRNLQFPGTRIHCTYKGGYTTKEVLSSSDYTGTTQNDCSFESFDVCVGSPSSVGRCFIEVENGFKGNSFPLIITNYEICQELRILESEFVEDKQIKDAIHFLNELGWLFQKKNDSSNALLTHFSASRFKFLLIFAVERDWLVLTRTLLDILVEVSLKDGGFMHESLGMLSAVQLLSRAVERKCQKMIHLLLHYSLQPSPSNLKIYLFPPNLSDPGGFTPLHLAASMQNSEGIVDELTNDPQEIALSCWESLKDENGQTPFTYASVRNNHSYNSLVARKLGDRKNGQITISVESQNTKLSLNSCARCAVVEKRLFTRMARKHGLLRHLYAYPLLVVAAVCVCVSLFCRGVPHIMTPEIGLVPFKWENLEFGPR
ncbi:Squamosa promoter-binding-like protein 15 [Apostasia shenzhenica]|uniref:Squamosa promoter-binding-like protein 15 n=1 Tax=Apostasia shenzhenica TaxID=1088818 RepID=A0A2I0ABA9_9ASPA|nr:Squamosa promoter-binding-like protein 15 [Apostasia shenzhenica]